MLKSISRIVCFTLLTVMLISASPRISLNLENLQCFTPRDKIPMTWLNEEHSYKYRPLVSTTETYVLAKLIANINIINSKQLKKLCFQRDYYFDTQAKDNKLHIIQTFSMFGKFSKIYYNTTVEEGEKSVSCILSRKKIPDKDYEAVWKNKSRSLFLMVSCAKNFGMTWFTASLYPKVSSDDKKKILKIIGGLGFDLNSMIEVDYDIC